MGKGCCLHSGVVCRVAPRALAVIPGQDTGLAGPGNRGMGAPGSHLPSSLHLLFSRPAADVLAAQVLA